MMYKHIKNNGTTDTNVFVLSLHLFTFQMFNFQQFYKSLLLVEAQTHTHTEDTHRRSLT